MEQDSREDPGGREFACATPSDEMMIRLCGGHSFNGATLTQDQMRCLCHVYGYSDAQTAKDAKVSAENTARAAEKRVGGPPRTRPATEEELRKFYEAGGHRHVLRRAACDGMRLVAAMVKYMEPGEDPVKLLLQLMSNAGYDVDASDLAWAFGDDDDGYDDEEEEA